MTIISSDVEATGSDGFDFSTSNQLVMIKSGVIVSSDQSDGVFASSGNTEDILYNDGSIISGGQLFAGLAFFSAGGYVENDPSGIISGWNGIFFGSGGERLLNEGMINGEYQGINGGDTGLTITNSGTIQGGDYGILLSGGSDNISSSGLISGARAVSLSITSGSMTLVNSGQLSGSTDALDTSGVGSLSFTNSGLVAGDVLLANTGGDTIRNTGKIDGDVHLGGGTNVFNSVGGTVAGTIRGGSGVDTIRLGSDGETVNGAAGHDSIYGGAGADTFAFSSIHAADYDHIYGFNVATDRIQLNHAEFTALTPGATPVFSIASSATSASDHLFYNSNTGWLFYDPDGTGSQAADRIANFGTGLHLAGRNFTVI